MSEGTEAHELSKSTDETKGEGASGTAEQVEQLEQLHRELRQLRARLPELMQTLATPSDDESSLELFHKIAREAATWKTEAVAFQSKYKAAEATMVELQEIAVKRQKQQEEQKQHREQSRTHSSNDQRISPTAVTGVVDDMAPSLDYGLDFDDMVGEDLIV